MSCLSRLFANFDTLRFFNIRFSRYNTVATFIRHGFVCFAYFITGILRIPSPVFPSVPSGKQAFRLSRLFVRRDCSNNYHRGDKGIRTLDPLLARQVLSQLSYTPIIGLNGLEPSTSRLSGVRSNQLSYRPICCYERCSLKIKQPIVLNPSGF